MLPATSVARPAARQRAPVNAVTVVLPFEPVIASTFCPGGSARAKSSTSPTSSAPRATAATIAGWSFATPGLMAMRSAPAKVASVSGPVASGTPGSVGAEPVRERRRRPRVGDPHLRPARREVAREREPRESESQHDRVAPGVVH